MAAKNWQLDHIWDHQHGQRWMSGKTRRDGMRWNSRAKRHIKRATARRVRRAANQDPETECGIDMRSTVANWYW